MSASCDSFHDSVLSCVRAESWTDGKPSCHSSKERRSHEALDAELHRFEALELSDFSGCASSSDCNFDFGGCSLSPLYKV